MMAVAGFGTRSMFSLAVLHIRQEHVPATLWPASAASAKQLVPGCHIPRIINHI
jgi:hypothetical protein